MGKSNKRTEQIWINGKLVPKTQATVSVFDTGFAHEHTGTRPQVIDFSQGR